MAMEVPSDVKAAPEFTTVARYTVTRLGEPSLFVEFAETCRQWRDVLVLSARDEDADGVFEVLELKTGQEPLVIGAKVFDGATLLGTVASESTPTIYQEVVLSGGGPTNADECALRTPVVNKFGHEVHVPSGRSWSYLLSAGRPGHLSRMSKALTQAAVELVLQALGQLGVNRTRAQVRDVVLAMQAEGINLDGIIAQELEDLERSRRNRTWEPEGGTTSGEVPGV